MQTPRDTPLTPYLAAEIRAEMGRLNMSAANLALRLGKPKTTVYRWQAGHTPVAVDDIPSIAAALDVTVVELVGNAVRRRERAAAAAASGLAVTTAQSWTPHRLAS